MKETHFFLILATCPIDWIHQKFDGINYCYKFEQTRMDFNKAESSCLATDSHLVSIHSQEENDFIWGNINNYLITFCLS